MILFFDNKILNLNGNVSNNDPDPSVSIVKLEDNLGVLKKILQLEARITISR